MTPVYFNKGRCIAITQLGKYRAVKDGPDYRPQVKDFDTYEEAVAWIQL